MLKKKRILIFPNTNTFSHLSRAFALAEWFDSADFETHIGISAKRFEWGRKFHSRCHEILEPWEFFGVPYPCTLWFSSKNNIENCISSQEKLIREIKPGLIIGIFDFISSVSSGNIPRISINGACMLPSYSGVLGFDETDSPLRERQKKLFDNFWAFAASSFKPSMQKRMRPFKKMANEFLEGDFNFIYEIEEISGLDGKSKNYYMTGPIIWDGWETQGEKILWKKTSSRKTVYINSGTLSLNPRIVQKIKRISLSTGARVLLSSGMDGLSETSDDIFSRPFLSPSGASGILDAVICTGGIGACYVNLLNGKPSLVIPTQPEQATNGINLERAGCGKVLVKNIIFTGDYRKYEEAIDYDKFKELLEDILENAESHEKLSEMKKAILKYKTREFITGFVKNIL